MHEFKAQPGIDLTGHEEMLNNITEKMLLGDSTCKFRMGDRVKKIRMEDGDFKSIGKKGIIKGSLKVKGEDTYLIHFDEDEERIISMVMGKSFRKLIFGYF